MNNTDLEKEILKLVRQNSYEKGYVCAVDVLLQLGVLSKKDYENWRLGKVNYLEQVCSINLSKLTLVNKLIKKYSTDLKLKSSWTGYSQWGKGVKRRLRFSKSGNKSIEDGYATHYIDKERIAELKKEKLVRDDLV